MLNSLVQIKQKKQREEGGAEEGGGEERRGEENKTKLFFISFNQYFPPCYILWLL